MLEELDAAAGGPRERLAPPASRLLAQETRDDLCDQFTEEAQRTPGHERLKLRLNWTAWSPIV
jgi:hypothetical protein